MGLSTNGETTILAALLTGRYLSAHTASPGNTGANEIVGNNYARVAAGAFSNTGNNPTVAANSTVIDFPQASGAWGTITHVGLWSALTGGTFLGWVALTVSKSVTLDDILRFPVGTLTFSTDDV